MTGSAAGLVAGWMPTRVQVDPPSGLYARGVVRMIEIGDEALSDPFLHQTFRRLRQEANPRQEVDIDLELFSAIADTLPEVRPAGFIFHVSRCGSTLVANALKTDPDLLVLSEPHAPTILLAPPRGPLSPFTQRLWDRTRDDLLRRLLRVYAGFRGDAPARVVIKFPSNGTLEIASVRRLWPDVPCVVLIRNPIEVLVASLTGGVWRDLQSDGARCLEVLGWEGAEMSATDFRARALGQLQKTALASLDAGCMVVDYAQLTPEVIGAIARHFGATLRRGPELEGVMRRYSKDPRGETPFRDDALAKQIGAPMETRAAALAWAGASYQSLKAIAMGAR